jgi:hypothetical protein
VARTIRFAPLFASRERFGLIESACSQSQSAIERHPALYIGGYIARLSEKWKSEKTAYSYINSKIDYFVKGEVATPSSSPREDTVIQRKNSKRRKASSLVLPCLLPLPRPGFDQFGPFLS